MNITHAKVVTVPVSDQDQAKSFYAGTLGLEVLADRQVGPMRWLQVAPKGAQTSFMLASGLPGLVPGAARGIILETADLDADCTELLRSGVQIDGPASRPWGREAMVTDPDGNHLVLAEAAPSAP